MRPIKPGGLVFVGAALGALARGLIDEAASSNVAGINASTIIVNLVGRS